MCIFLGIFKVKKINSISPYAILFFLTQKGDYRYPPLFTDNPTKKLCEIR